MKSDSKNKTQTQKYKVKLLFPDGDKPEVVEEIDVPVFLNPDFGEEEITPEGRELIEQTKAKFLRRFSSKDVRELRESLGLSGVRMSRLLGLGDKTVARWESTGEWPSRSICVILNALRAGKIDINYLNSLEPSRENPNAIEDSSFENQNESGISKIEDIRRYFQNIDRSTKTKSRVLSFESHASGWEWKTVEIIKKDLDCHSAISFLEDSMNEVKFG